MSLTNAPRLLRALTSEPLAIDRRTFDAFTSVLRRRGLEGISFDGPELHAELQVAMPRATRTEGSEQRIQVIPLVGTIANRAQSMGIGATRFAAKVEEAAADPRVDGILVEVDSPGGSVTGVPEAAEAVFNARASKPVTTFVNGLMASAGYWIGAAAEEVIASRSSEAGSIGVFMLHEDWTENLAADGIVVTEISAGRFKTEGAPWKALDDEAKEYLQARVTEAYDWFVSDVARYRGDTVQNVRSGYGEGRVLGARDAVAAKLIDRVGTMADALESVAQRAAERKPKSRRSSRAAEDIRARRRG